VILYNYQLSRSVGAEGLIALTVIVQLSAAVLKKLTPPFGRLAAEEARLEGQFRTTHSKYAAAIYPMSTNPLAYPCSADSPLSLCPG